MTDGDQMLTKRPERTVGERLDELRRHRRSAVTWVAGGPARLDRKIAALELRDPDEALWSITDALTSSELRADQRAAIHWQMRRYVDLGGFWGAFWEAATLADDDNLARLAAGFPDEIEGLRRWREEPGYSEALRDLPLDFNL